MAYLGAFFRIIVNLTQWNPIQAGIPLAGKELFLDVG
jgi:hypothetical protein